MSQRGQRLGADILDHVEATATRYRGIDQFVDALRAAQVTGRHVLYKDDPGPGIQVLIDGRAVGVVALLEEQGESPEMLYARLDELLRQ